MRNHLRADRRHAELTGPYREADQGVLEEWYRQQQAGYQVSNRGTRFAQQIAYYNRRLLEAEADLERLIRRGGQDS